MKSPLTPLIPTFFIRYNQQILDQQNKEIKTQQLPSIFANASAAFNKTTAALQGFNLFLKTMVPRRATDYHTFIYRANRQATASDQYYPV